MPSTNRKLLIFGALLIFAVTSGCSVSSQAIGKASHQKSNAEEEYAPHFNLQTVSNNRWQPRKRVQEKPLESEYFSFRREQPRAGAIFINSPATGLVFKYEPATKQLELSSHEQWQKASGEIINRTDLPCGSFSGFSEEYLDIEYKYIENKGKSFEVTVPLRGKYFWQWISTPDRKRVFIISADGPVTKVGIRLWNFNILVEGTKYLEVFNLEDKNFGDYKRTYTRVGQPVKVNLPQTTAGLYPCWTTEEDFIIIPDAFGPEISIVDINALTQRQK